MFILFAEMNSNVKAPDVGTGEHKLMKLLSMHSSYHPVLYNFSSKIAQMVCVGNSLFWYCLYLFPSDSIFTSG